MKALVLLGPLASVLLLLFAPQQKLQYARTKSDAVAKMDGTFKGSKKRRAEPPAGGAQQQPQPGGARGSTAGGSRPAPSGPAHTLPNKLLFVEDLPHATTAEMLTMLFQQFPGFAEVRMVPAKPGIAFVEFEGEAQAGVAKAGLDGFKITPENSMSVSYAKR